MISSFEVEPDYASNPHERYTYTKETARAVKALVEIQTQMLTAIDPSTRADELDKAAARADAAVAQIDVQVDASAARISQLEQQLAEQAGASVARINELEQQLKAAKAVASDAGGDKLIELLTEIAAANKETNARLAKMEKNQCCVVA